MTYRDRMLFGVLGLFLLARTFVWWREEHAQTDTTTTQITTAADARLLMADSVKVRSGLRQLRALVSSERHTLIGGTRAVPQEAALLLSLVHEADSLGVRVRSITPTSGDRESDGLRVIMDGDGDRQAVAALLAAVERSRPLRRIRRLRLTPGDASEGEALRFTATIDALVLPPAPTSKAAP